MPERIAAQDHGAHPEDSSENIEDEITAIGHSRCAGHRRTKRSNDGDETRKDDGPAAIFFVEVVSPLKMAQSITGISSHFRGMTPPAERMPAVTRRESPGRKKPTKKPVSIKTIVQMSGAPPARISSRSPSGPKSDRKK